MRADSQGAAGQQLAAQRAEITDAGRVLSGLGLVTAFGHVSARAGAAMLITPAADLAGVGPADLIEVDLAAAALPAGAPAEAWVHLRVYAARPDVSAIARAQPPAAFAAAAVAAPSAATAASAFPATAVTAELPPLHGQACWLGRTVPVHDQACLLRSSSLADAAARDLGESDALLLRGNGALTCGLTPGLAVTRMWLLAAACDTWLAASRSGTPRPLGAAEIESWRAVQDELLPRLWRHLCGRVAGQSGRGAGQRCDD